MAAASARPVISVVAPTMNEEENVLPFYERTTAALAQLQVPFEIIFVNDGSTDGTAEKLEALRAQDARVKVIHFSRNFGSYAAIEAGFAAAAGDAIASISVDLQDPPEMLADLYARWRAGFDIVWAVRETRDDPVTKTLMARGFYRVLQWAAFPDLPDNGMDCGLFDRAVIDEYLKIHDRDNIPFMTLFWMGYKQTRIPYSRGPRVAGETKWPFWKRVKAALDVIVAFSYKPLRLLTFGGVLLALFGLVGAIASAVVPLVTPTPFRSYLFLAASVTLIGGIQLVGLGLLGEYIWRISEQVRGRPRYLTQTDSKRPPVE